MCKNTPIKYSTEVIEIPYFDEVVITTIHCDKCDYKYSDLIITNQNEPLEFKFKISGLEDMNVRIIRSSTATIEIPEIGIKIEPAAAAEAFITNIEGLLNRILSVVQTAISFASNEKKKKNAEKVLLNLKKIINGKAEGTIIIKDPMGNSVIQSDKVETRKLTPEEVETLETGMTIIDTSNQRQKILE